MAKKTDPKERVAQRLSNTLQQLQNIREELLTVERLNGLTFAQCPSSDRLIMTMCGYTSPKEWHDAVVNEYNNAAKRYTKYRKQLNKLNSQL